jgi:hypothetical protein
LAEVVERDFAETARAVARALLQCGQLDEAWEALIASRQSEHALASSLDVFVWDAAAHGAADLVVPAATYPLRQWPDQRVLAGVEALLVHGHREPALRLAEEHLRGSPALRALAFARSGDKERGRSALEGVPVTPDLVVALAAVGEELRAASAAEEIPDVEKRIAALDRAARESVDYPNTRYMRPIRSG